MTDVEALETGIGFEKDSILFYSEIRGMVPKLDQEIVDTIISEERKHFSELTYMADQLRSGM
jgi:rubrerythrin